MNEKALRVLEYTKIIDRLSGLAGSALGRDKCKNLMPLVNLHEIERMQKETSDALARIYAKGTLSFSGIPDVRGSLKRLEIGATLGAGELLKISSVLTATLRAKNYGYNQKNSGETQEAAQDSLTEMFQLLEPLSPINTEIMRCIISEEEIADDASAGDRKSVV